MDLNRPIRNTKGKVVGYKPCGRPSAKGPGKGKYPLCRPSRRVSPRTPRTLREISKKSITRAKRDKSRVKHTRNIKFGAGPGNRENHEDLEKQGHTKSLFLFGIFIGVVAVLLR